MLEPLLLWHNLLRVDHLLWLVRKLRLDHMLRLRELLLWRLGWHLRQCEWVLHLSDMCWWSLGRQHGHPSFSAVSLERVCWDVVTAESVRRERLTVRWTWLKHWWGLLIEKRMSWLCFGVWGMTSSPKEVRPATLLIGAERIVVCHRSKWIVLERFRNNLWCRLRC